MTAPFQPLAEFLIQRLRRAFLMPTLMGSVGVALLTAQLIVWVEIRDFRGILQAVKEHVSSLSRTNDVPEIMRLMRSIHKQNQSDLLLVKNGVVAVSTRSTAELDLPYGLSPIPAQRVLWRRLLLLVAEPLDAETVLVVEAPLLPVVLATLLVTILVVGLCLTFGAAYMWLTKTLIARELCPLQTLTDSIRNVRTDTSVQSLPPFAIAELEQIRGSIVHAQRELIEARKYFGLGDLAAQVAHDIRSPLSTLTIALDHLRSVNPEVVSLSWKAVKRIEEVASDLSQRFRDWEGNTHGTPAPTWVYPVVHELVLEKQLQYLPRPGLKLLARWEESAAGIFASAPPKELRRVLSNLIDNAAEAIPETGQIEVRLGSREDRLHLEVEDNGIGIPKNILPWVMQKGKTFGKLHGTGLGLYHAKSKVSEWGGSIAIRSEEKVGTTIEISLPLLPVPSWAVTGLTIAAGSEIVVLDDQSEIRDAWLSRLSPLSQLKYFPDSASFESYLSETRTGTLYLVDYDLREWRDGLSIITQNGIQDRSVLVTSQEISKELIKHAQSANVKILSKPFIPFIPIRISAPEKEREAYGIA